jgi:hypothetical protein
MEPGILRWEHVTRTVRAAAVRGFFGGNHRVSQLADGTWQISDGDDELVTASGMARRVGDQLFMPSVNFGGQPIELDGQPWDADPEPFFDLSSYSTSGWILMYGTIGVADGEIQPPMTAELTLGLMPASDMNVLHVPLAIVRGNLVLSPPPFALS